MVQKLLRSQKFFAKDLVSLSLKNLKLKFYGIRMQQSSMIPTNKVQTAKCAVESQVKFTRNILSAFGTYNPHRSVKTSIAQKNFKKNYNLLSPHFGAQ